MIGTFQYFTGEWTDQVYSGIVCDWMSQGPFFKVTRTEAERIVVDQNNYAETCPEAGRMILVGDFLVNYEPVDREFYVEEFDDEQLVRIPGWTWQIAPEPDTASIAKAMRDLGLYVTEECGPGPTDLEISTPYGRLVMVRHFNRDGWEAAWDTGGDQVGLDDGPEAHAAPEEVAKWAARLYATTAVTLLDTPV